MKMITYLNMKEYSQLQVEAIVKMKFGRMVNTQFHTSYVSNAILGRLFKCSASKVRQLYMDYFAELRKKQRPLMEILQQAQSEVPRKNYGYRFLKQHQIAWLASADTLRRQTGLSLADRCGQFRLEFPSASMNVALLRKVYRLHKIKKRKYRWYKLAKEYDEAKQRQQYITMKQ